jgi:hypothetical protein
MRIAKRACMGPMRMNPAAAASQPKWTPRYASSAVHVHTSTTARTLRQLSMARKLARSSGIAMPFARSLGDGRTSGSIAASGTKEVVMGPS